MKNLNVRKDKINTDQIISELNRVKNIYKRSFTKREFDKVAVSCKSTRVINEFKSWQAALLEINVIR